jgi:hypothetical protein
VEILPSEEEIKLFLQEDLSASEVLKTEDLDKIHLQAQLYLEKEEPVKAWKLLLAKRN